jgi:hypothetical protein
MEGVLRQIDVRGDLLLVPAALIRLDSICAIGVAVGRLQFHVPTMARGYVLAPVGIASDDNMRLVFDRLVAVLPRSFVRTDEQYIVNADAVLAATCSHSNGTATLNVYFDRGSGAVYPACWSQTGSPSRALSAIAEARSHERK